MFKDVLPLDLVLKNHKILLKLGLIFLVVCLSGCSSAVILNPAGSVGEAEKTLIIIAAALMLLVVVPAIFMTILFAWKFRESNKNAQYAPDWNSSHIIETIVWAVPTLIVIALSVLVWIYSFALDPYNPIKPHIKPLVIEVVSLDWKWLFIYPEQKIATVNQVVFPTHTPIHFQITSSTVMNSFFIPQLGSQIMTMGGMKTQLYLIAEKPGTYDGLSANFSGAGFTGMTFKATAGSEKEFTDWIASVKKSPKALDQQSYLELSKQSTNHPVEYFSTVQPNFLHNIIQQTQQPINPSQSLGQE